MIESEDMYIGGMKRTINKSLRSLLNVKGSATALGIQNHGSMGAGGGAWLQE